MHLKLIIILAITCCFNFTAAGYYPQYLQAYRYKSCLGPAVNFLETNTNVTGLTYKSNSVRGLWRLIEDGGGVTITMFEPYSSTGRSCLTRVEPKEAVVNSVHSLAIGDFDDSVLTLYSSENFDGEPLVIDEQGMSKVEQEKFNIGSWALTGSQSYTVFDGESFTGNATCLQVESQASRDGLGISVRWTVEDELLVRSARVGCDGRKIRSLRGDSKKRILTRDANGVVIKEGVRGKLETRPEVIVVA